MNFSIEILFELTFVSVNRHRYQESDISLTYEISTSGGPLQTKMYAASE